MLIKCPECGKEISSEADKCPSCGYPIKKTAYCNSEKQDVEIKQKVPKDEKMRIILGITIFIFIIIMQMSTGFNLPIYYAMAGFIILILRKKMIGSIICLVPLMIGDVTFIMFENYNEVVGGLCWLLTIFVIASIFVKDNK